MDDLDLPPDHHAGGLTPPTMSQDQAVIAWLATRPTLPTLTRDLLIDVLVVLEALAPLPPVTAQPGGGTDIDAGELLREIDQRLLQHPHHPDDLTSQLALADAHHLLGLAGYSLVDPDGARAGRDRTEQQQPWLVQLRAREADTAVDLALADLRRERGE